MCIRDSLGAVRHFDLQIAGSSFRPEFIAPPEARLAHFGFVS